MVTTRPPKTIVEPTALGTVANTNTKLLIYRLFQKGRVLAQDGIVWVVEGEQLPVVCGASAIKCWRPAPNPSAC